MLPFADLSPAGDQQYFADGLCEEIINALTRVPGLRVAARTSSFTFRGGEQDLRAVATALGVGSVLEGSVRREGERLRISATLVDARDGLHLWSGSFDRRLPDVFEIQREIAVAVVESIRGEIGLEPARRVLAARPPADFRAYELYLRGRSLHDRRGDVAAMREAAALFEEALQLDPHYAPAHAGLAETYYALWDYIPLFGEQTEPSLDRALASARQAVQLDPGLAYAHAVLGSILSFRHDWSGAMASLERATELDPGSARARHWLGTVLMMRGERARGLAEVEQALRLDPLSPNINWQLGRFLVFIGQLDEGIDRLHHSLRLNPANEAARFYMAWAYDKQGREQAAAEAMLPLSPAVARPLFRVGTRLFGVDFLVRALYTLAAWRSDTPCLPRPYMGAGMLAYLGDRGGVFRCLGESVDFRSLFYIKVDPLFDPYRDDPRFDALLARVGLAD